MGQKVNPHGLRVGVIKDWDSRWYARDDKVGDLIVEDYNIRKYLKKTLYAAGIAKIEIERNQQKVKINIHCSRPGVVIGKGGQEIEKLRQLVESKLGKPVALNIVEVRSPDLNAQLVADTIPLQTLRADIDYGFAEAATTYGRIGVKVWIYKGEVLNSTLRTENPEPARRERRDGDRRRGERNGRRPYNGNNHNGERRNAGRREGGNR